MGSFPGSLSAGTAAGFGGLAGGLGALAGLFPNTASGSYSSNLNTAQSGSTTQNIDLLNLINTLSKTLGTSNLATTQAVTPTMTPETQRLLSELTNRYGAMTAPSLTGYSAQQTANINANADLQRQAVNNIMASRGLSTSPVAATAEAAIQQNRLNQITGMQQQIPILQNQMNLANLAGATGFFSTIPKGATTTGTQAGQTATTQTGTQTQKQTGGVTGTSQQIGSQQGAGTQQQQSGGGVGGLFQGLASGAAAVLPWLLMGLSDKNLKKDIKEITQDKAIEKIRELRGRSWKWKGGEVEDSGVIAQELEKVLPNLVHNVKVSDIDLKAVNYAGLVPYLIGAVQNLDARLSETGG